MPEAFHACTKCLSHIISRQTNNAVKAKQHVECRAWLGGLRGSLRRIMSPTGTLPESAEASRSAE